MLTEDEMFDCMAETGKEHQKAIDKAKEDGTSYTPDAPIHVMQFATALGDNKKRFAFSFGPP